MKLNLVKQLDVKSIATNEIGTYPLQSIIESQISEDEGNIIIDKIKPNFIELSMNKYSVHILEKALANRGMNTYSIFFTEIVDNFLILSTNQYGVKLIKMFAVKVLEAKDYFHIFEKIAFENINKLINDEYGNYLIQTIIDYWHCSYSSKIISLYEGSLLSLSNKKYASNVIEKLLKKYEYVSK